MMALNTEHAHATNKARLIHFANTWAAFMSLSDDCTANKHHWTRLDKVGWLALRANSGRSATATKVWVRVHS